MSAEEVRLRKHSPDAARWIGELFLRSTDLVIDIGAGDGRFSELWSAMVPRGLVIAVEPCDAFALSGVEWRQSVVGSQVGYAAFHASEEAKHSSLYAANCPRVDAVSTVPMTTVDTIVWSLSDVPRLIKVDAQGAEAEIVRGAAKTLYLPVVWIIELWREGLRAAGASVLDVLQPFKRHGYRPYTVFGQRMRWRHVLHEADALRGASSVDLLCVPRGLRVPSC